MMKTEHQPKVSLIIPVYNFENYIKTTLDTVFNQTYPNLEIIVVNDGSTDKSAHIVSALQKKHKNLILINKNNSGVSAARNTGIENATGEYICFSDADDLLHPEYVAYLVGNAINYNVDISIGTGLYTNYKIGNLPSDNSRLHEPEMLEAEDAIIKMLTYWYPIGCVCRAFHKSLFEKGLRFIPGQKVGEGFTFNIKAMLLTNRVVVGNKPIYCYRRDNDKSCMTQFSIERVHDAINSIYVIRTLFTDPSIELSNALDFAELHTKSDMYNWIVLTKNEKLYHAEYKEYLKYIKTFCKKVSSLELNKKEHTKLFIQRIHPRLLAQLLILRKKF